MAFNEGTRIGPYEIVGKIGAGGMGEVWKAKDTRLGRDVAIKVLPAAFAEAPDRLKRFEQEARMVAALSHPNVLAIFDVGTYEGSPYLVSELLKGATLRERISGGALPVSKTLDIAIQVARGLAAAHDKGIIHRDLKPENIFLTHEGVKILDFGLAKQAPVIQQGSQSELPTRDFRNATQEGAILGTVGYMSPEQVRGEAVDARSDLFALGVVIYEMLSGRQAFHGRTQADTLSAILREEPPELDSGLKVPPLLERVLRSCLSKDLEGRFHSAHDLAFALQSAMDAGATSASGKVPVQTDTGEQKHSRRRRLWAAAGVLVLGISVGVYWTPRHLDPVRIPSVLALPAKVLGSQDSAFLTDAIPDTLSTLLAGVEGLDSKVPPSSLQVEKLKGDLAKIAEAYHVEHLVLTTVTAQGENLILNVKLAEAATQKVRWAGQYEGTRGTYNQLLRQAADALARTLKPGAAGPALNGEPAMSSEFELAMKEGQHYQNRYGASHQPQDFERSKNAFERAMKEDPSNAQAVGELAGLWIIRSWDGSEKDRSSVSEAERLARRAIAMDPRTGAAWSALANSEASKRPASMEKALEFSIKAVSPRMRQPDTGASLAGAVGGPIFMAATGRRAFEANPLSAGDGAMAAIGLTWQGKPEETLRLVDKVLQVEPGDRFGLVAKSQALVSLGRLDEAGRLLERCKPLEADLFWDAELWRQIQFQLAVARGDTATTKALADRASKLWLGPESRNLDGNAAWTMIPGLMRMGRREDALRLLEKGVELYPNAEGYLQLFIHPDLHSLRRDQRFLRLFEKGKKDVALALRMLQEAKSSGDLPAHFDGPMAQLQELLNRTR